MNVLVAHAQRGVLLHEEGNDRHDWVGGRGDTETPDKIDDVLVVSDESSPSIEAERPHLVEGSGNLCSGNSNHNEKSFGSIRNTF